MRTVKINTDWQSAGLIILTTVILCFCWLAVKFLFFRQTGREENIRVPPAILMTVKWLKRCLSPGRIILLIIVALLWRLIQTSVHLSMSSPTTARQMATSSPFRLKPVYVCHRPEHFQIIAPPGDPRDRSGWNNQIVLPDYCRGEITSYGKVWIVDENGNVYENGPPELGYRHWDFPPDVRHLWYHSQKNNDNVVVDVRFTPSRFH